MQGFRAGMQSVEALAEITDANISNSTIPGFERVAQPLQRLQPQAGEESAHRSGDLNGAQRP